MESEMVKTAEQIDANLNHLTQMEYEADQTELRRSLDIRDARLRAERCRSISTFFDHVAETHGDPDVCRTYMMEARHFREMAHIEENHVSCLIQSDDRWAELKARRAELLANLLALPDKASLYAN